ncbi:hypothetical protein SHIRM173S_04048 [Streptomyces hirsutus]
MTSGAGPARRRGCGLVARSAARSGARSHRRGAGGACRARGGPARRPGEGRPGRCGGSRMRGGPRLRGRELAPCRPAAAWGRFYAGGRRGLPDRRGADRMSEAGGFALDPSTAPPRILPGRWQHRRLHRAGGRWPAWPPAALAAVPLDRDEPAVPREQGRGRDREHPRPSASREQRRRRGEPDPSPTASATAPDRRAACRGTAFPCRSTENPDVGRSRRQDVRPATQRKCERQRIPGHHPLHRGRGGAQIPLHRVAARPRRSSHRAGS